MKLASFALQDFLTQRQNLGIPANVMVADVYTLVTGAGRMVINQRLNPIGRAANPIVPVDALGITGTVMQDISAREITGDCLQWVPFNPGVGQYGYAGTSFFFGDNNPKFVSYIYRIGQTYGLPTPNIVKLCSLDRNITLFGKQYLSAGLINGFPPAPGIQRSKVRVTIGLETTSLDVMIYADPSNTVNNLPILQQVANGFFDGASCYVQRLIMPGWNQSVGGIIENGLTYLFFGTVAEQEPGRSSAKLTVKSRTEILNTNMPRNLFQTGCRHTLFDAGCGLDPTLYLKTGSVQAGSNFSVIQTNLTDPVSIGPPVPLIPPVPPATFPVLGDVSDNNLNLNPARYWVVITYATATGETSPSQEATRAVTRNRLLTVDSPTNNPPGALGYYVYAGLSPGNWQRQNSPTTAGAGGPISFASAGGPAHWTESGNGLVQGGPPPITSSGGWFTEGVITFTSGVLTGQSRVISDYSIDPRTGLKAITVVPAFPVSPAQGDTFTVLPGCDKQQYTCFGKFNNLKNFAGFPYIPSPEAVI